MKQNRLRRFSTVTFAASAALLLVSSVTFNVILRTHDLQPGPTHALSGDITWPAFDGGGADQGANYNESRITTGNAGQLTKLWQAGLPIKADNAAVEAANVSTSAGTIDLVIVNTVKGNLRAFNANTGALVWQADPSAANYNGQGTKSTPAINGSYVYAYALDGYVHRYNLSNGAESSGGGFPAQVTLLPNDIEKGSASINIANGYLYMTLSGNDGDYGHYVGHVVAVNLSSGAKTVWNALCADITSLQNTSSCSYQMSGIWARPGVTIDPVTGNVFVAVGNGNYNASSGGNNWGDSIVELTPSLGSIVDSYTPATYSTLDSNDADLGSTAPVMLPTQSGSNTPYLLVQGGKDHIVRLLNRSNLSGQGGPRHTGGELQKITISNEVHEQPAVWKDGSGVTWVYVTDDSGDLYGYKVLTSGGVTTLSQAFHVNDGTTSSPLVANGVLYVDGDTILAYNATTGARLFDSGNIGIYLNQHWESPVLANSMLFTPDGNTSVIALYVPGVTPTSSSSGSSGGSGSSSGSTSTSSSSSSKTPATPKPSSAPTESKPSSTKTSVSTSVTKTAQAKPAAAKPTGLAAFIINIVTPVAQFLHLQLAGDLIRDSYNRNKPLTVISLAVPILALLALLYVAVVPRLTRRLAAKLMPGLLGKTGVTSAVQVGTGGNATHQIITRLTNFVRRLHF